MRVILFDPVSDGHHVSYASHIISHLVEKGDDVTFVAWQPDESLDSLLESISPLTVEYVKKSSGPRFGGGTLTRSIRLAQGIQHSFKLAISQHADVVHHLYMERSEVPLYLQMRKLRTPSWRLFGTLFWPYFIHGPDDHVLFPKRLYHAANCLAVRELFRKKQLTALFVHTERIKAMALRAYGNESIRDRIVVVPDPVVPLASCVTQEEARARLGLPQGRPTFLYFGGLRWDKGPDILLEALQWLDGDWSAIVAGAPAAFGEADVEQYREKLRDPGRLIARLGHVRDEDMNDYFAAADAVVLPYRRAFKGTSGVLQRAAGAGKAVIACDVGEIGRIVRENRLGIVVEPESPESLAKGMRMFLAQRETLSEEVRSWAADYSRANHWHILAEKVRAAYVGCP
jgi:glycosyltransferase involved in cell wall biosynthesis